MNRSDSAQVSAVSEEKRTLHEGTFLTPLDYPETRIGDEVDTAAGLSFPDPYRWLREENEAVRAWQAAQNGLAHRYRDEWPYYTLLEQRVSHYFKDRISAVPRYVAGRWFRLEQATDSSLPCVVISREPFGAARRLPVRTEKRADAAPFLGWIAPSPDGSIIAVGVCSDGSENNRIVLLDQASGVSLPNAPPQLLMDAWMGGVGWLPDGSGFHFLGLQGEPNAFRQVVLFHDLASGMQSRAEIPLPEEGAPDYALITSSRDGRYLVASHGLFAPRPVAIKDLTRKDAAWRPFVTRIRGTLAGFVENDAFIALTDIDAPRGRVVAIPLDAEDPNEPSQWSELLPESDWVLRSVTPVGEELYITAFVDTYSRLGILDRAQQRVREVLLPSPGAIAEPIFPLMTLVPHGHPDELHFVFSSLIDSWGVYRHRPGAKQIETVRAPEVRIENAVVNDHWAISKDGTRIPYHTVHRTDVKRALPAPALIYAYGAFNLPLLPEYPGAIAAFIAAGGIYVHGHIRGGAELGREWWHAGRMKNKQNGYEDLYAIAEQLVATGLTTHAQLALTGRSNGGLMAGVAATQRPDLWRAIVSQVPVTDLIGILHDAYGRYALASEYGDPSVPEEILRLASFSPYHLVKSGVEYPAVFIEAGETDPRCPSWHARKLAARLQAASKAGGHPILLRVRANAGHGPATPKAIQLESYVEWLAFVMRELNLRPESERPRE